MSDFNNHTVYRTSAGAIDGLKAYMQRIYATMSMGLGLTGIVAMLVASSPEMIRFFLSGPMKYVVMFAPLGMVLFLSFRLMHMSAAAARLTFYIYAAVMGISLSTILLMFTGQSVARIFFITAAVFLSMSLYGYTTRKDLTSMGSFLFMGLIGIIIASLVNLFMASSALQFAISVLAVLIFTGLTAYDTQRLRELYFDLDGSAETAGKIAVFGALALYLDFINIFIHLIQLFGERR